VLIDVGVLSEIVILFGCLASYVELRLVGFKHTHTHTERERETDRHIQRERERERERKYT